MDAYSSYYSEEPIPQIPSPYTTRNVPVSESVEKRRRKRERAATFVNDEEARQAVARQIAEEEARLKAAEARAVEHRRARERDAKEAKRRQDRSEALARLEAQQLREDAYNQQMAAEREAKDRMEYEVQKAYDERKRREEADARRRSERKEARQRQLLAEARRQEEEEEQALQARREEEAKIQKGQARLAAREEEEARRLRQQHRENARRTRDLEIAEKERTQALKDANESKRIQELEAEVQQLRRELQEAKKKQEEAAALSLNNSRHVHFAPTPPCSESLHAEQSFLSHNTSTSSSSLQYMSKQPPAAPPAPPPPPPLAPPVPGSLAGARPSPLALLAAHKATAKTSEVVKKRPSIVNAAVGMPADMGKFLNEMKNTKLKKVGLPVEGAKKPRDDEETGLKSILGQFELGDKAVRAQAANVRFQPSSEGVLKKRFLGEKDRNSGSTGTSSTPNLSNNSRLSTSTDSLTSFSSYRPPDWSMDMDSSPFPPLRSTSLPRRAAAYVDSPSTSAAPQSILPKDVRATTSGLSRTISQPHLPRHRPTEPAANSGIKRSQSFVSGKSYASYGQAITCEEPAPTTRQKTQPYTGSHHRQSSQSTPLQRPPSFAEHRKQATDIADPSTAATTRTRQSSDNTMTGRSIRSVGSSFDIELYTQMQLQEDNDSLEEEMRRSFSNPPHVDGAMDFASPTGPASPVDQSSSGQRLKTRSQYQIPELVFRQPAFSFGPELGLPSARPRTEGGRKVSYYTHPRPAPAPPSIERRQDEVDEKPSHRGDARGRPLSPSKSRAWQKGSRPPLQSLPAPVADHDDDEDVLLPYLTENQAEQILRDDDYSITGYGVATR